MVRNCQVGAGLRLVKSPAQRCCSVKSSYCDGGWRCNVVLGCTSGCTHQQVLVAMKGCRVYTGLNAVESPAQYHCNVTSHVISEDGNAMLGMSAMVSMQRRSMFWLL